MSKLLNESTVEELVNELKNRVSWMVLAIDLPSNNTGFLTSLGGDYISQLGAVKHLENSINYHTYMINKADYDDDPDKFFNPEDDF